MLLFARFNGISVSESLGDRIWIAMDIFAKWENDIKVVYLRSKLFPTKKVPLKRGDWLIVDLETKRFYKDLEYLKTKK